MVYREARKAKQIITQVTVMVRTKLENAVAITCALVSTAVFFSFVSLVTVGLMGELYPGLRKSAAFRSAETLLQMNSIVIPLIYFYRNHRFRNIVLEILCIRKPPVAKSKVAPMQHVRSKDPFSKKGIQEQPSRSRFVKISVMRISQRDRIKSCNAEKTCIGSFTNQITQRLF